MITARVVTIELILEETLNFVHHLDGRTVFVDVFTESLVFIDASDAVRTWEVVGSVFSIDEEEQLVLNDRAEEEVVYEE